MWEDPSSTSEYSRVRVVPETLDVCTDGLTRSNVSVEVISTAGLNPAFVALTVTSTLAPVR